MSKPVSSVQGTLRALRPPVISGEDHHKATLTDEQVREMRSTEGSTRELARRFGVSQSTVSRIRRGESR